jgi:hypothetical protein
LLSKDIKNDKSEVYSDFLKFRSFTLRIYISSIFKKAEYMTKLDRTQKGRKNEDRGHALNPL